MDKNAEEASWQDRGRSLPRSVPTPQTRTGWTARCQPTTSHPPFYYFYSCFLFSVGDFLFPVFEAVQVLLGKRARLYNAMFPSAKSWATYVMESAPGGECRRVACRLAVRWQGRREGSSLSWDL